MILRHKPMLSPARKYLKSMRRIEIIVKRLLILAAVGFVALCLLLVLTQFFPDVINSLFPVTAADSLGRTAVVKKDGPISEKWRFGVVRLVTSTGQGSGWLYSPTMIITARHVVGNDNQVTIHFDPALKREACTGTVIYRGNTNETSDDIAAIRVTSQPQDLVLPCGDVNKLQAGEEVTALGYQISATEIQHSAGHVKGFKHTQELITTDATINPGDSGGPLISMKQRAVVGVCVGGIKNDVISGVNLAIQLDHVLYLVPK
jgi:S1-C subfamily serine protease